MARFVLVHGSSAGAWAWTHVVPLLDRAGHAVEALDLPGGGDDRTPVADVTLRSCVDRVLSVLEARPEPAVLVGASMGGVMITQAAADRPDRAQSLIFVAAFMPANGQSLLDLSGYPEGRDDRIQANFVLEGDPPAASLPEGVAEEIIYHDCPSELAAWAVARRRPQPVAPYATPVDVDDAVLDAIPRSYVVTLHDRSMPLVLQRRMIREHPCVRVVELEAGHAPYLSRPAELASALTELAAAMAPAID